MNNLKTYEEFSLFKRKEPTPDEEYRRQAAKEEKNRRRNFEETEPDEDSGSGSGFKNSLLGRTLTPARKPVDSSGLKPARKVGDYDPYSEEFWDE